MSEYSPAFYASFLNEGIVISDQVIKKEVNDMEEVASEIAEEPEEVYFSDIIFKGTNSSKVAILVNYEQEEWITVKDRLFLERILEAVHLRLESVALINMHKSGFSSVEQVGKKLPENRIIALGLDPGQTASLNKNEITVINNQHYLCMQWSLSEIVMSKDMKNLLWKNLKQLFQL